MTTAGGQISGSRTSDYDGTPKRYLVKRQYGSIYEVGHLELSEQSIRYSPRIGGTEEFMDTVLAIADTTTGLRMEPYLRMRGALRILIEFEETAIVVITRNGQQLLTQLRERNPNAANEPTRTSGVVDHADLRKATRAAATTITALVALALFIATTLGWSRANMIITAIPIAVTLLLWLLTALRARDQQRSHD